MNLRPGAGQDRRQRRTGARPELWGAARLLDADFPVARASPEIEADLAMTCHVLVEVAVFARDDHGVTA